MGGFLKWKTHFLTTFPVSLLNCSIIFGSIPMPSFVSLVWMNGLYWKTSEIDFVGLVASHKRHLLIWDAVFRGWRTLYHNAEVCWFLVSCSIFFLSLTDSNNLLVTRSALRDISLMDIGRTLSGETSLHFHKIYTLVSGCCVAGSSLLLFGRLWGDMKLRPIFLSVPSQPSGFTWSLKSFSSLRWLLFDEEL